MNCVTQSGISARIGASVVLFQAIAGTAAGQIETRDWLLPESGSWSDASRWSESNVPDTTMEIARLSPLAGRSSALLGSSLTATVDGEFLVRRIEGDGQILVLVPVGNSLSTDFGILGVSEGIQIVQIGEPDVAGDAQLIMSNGRAYVRNAIVSLAGPAESTYLAAPSGMYVADTGVIEGRGQITGTLRNFGLVRSQIMGSGSNELTFQDADIFNVNTISAGSNAALNFIGCTIEQEETGVIQNARTINLVDSTLSGGTVDTLGRSTLRVEGHSSMKEVNLAGTGVVVAGHVDLLSSEITNDGLFRTSTGGSIGIAEDFSFNGSGSLTVPGDAIQTTADYFLLINGSDHTLRSWGTLNGGLTNDGYFTPHRSNADSTSLTIRGPFEQRASGEMFSQVTTIPGSLEFNRVIVEEADVSLDGKLRVAVWGNMDDVAGTPISLLEIVQNQQAHSIVGEFTEVELEISHYSTNISPIAGMTYLPDRVNLTLYCIADVNRDGVVTPSDFSAWVSAYNDADELADTNLDGVTDPKDFSAWVSAFNSGCGR